MKIKNLSIYFIILLLFLGCENIFTPKNENAKINLIITSPQNIVKTGSLQKTTNITRFTIIVTASDMDEINEDFNVTSPRVECELEVAKGKNRTFIVQGKDQNGRIQFVGETVVDIEGAEETVNIDNLSLIAPNPINLSIDNITDLGFELNWTKSNAPDFGFYRILISTNPQLHTGNDQVLNDITDVNRTHITINGAEPNTFHFVAVIVCDTENYFSGILEFNVDGSIVHRVKTLESSAPPEPVECFAGNITSSTFDLLWSKSNAPDFSFYRVLISQTPNLNVENDQIGDDIHDINMNRFRISDLEENSIYYTAVLNVNSNMEFLGNLEYDHEHSIVKKVTTAEQITLGYDDDTFENMLYDDVPGSRLLNKFLLPAPSTFISEVWFCLNDESGQDFNYRLVICDKDRNEIFYSVPLTTDSESNWVGWNIPWDNIAEGFVDSDFYVGIEYTKDIGWPEVLFDESSDHESGYYVDGAGAWAQLKDLEYFGNLGIVVVVDVVNQNEDGSTNNMHQMRLTPLTNSNIKIKTQLSGENLRTIPGRDTYKKNHGNASRLKSRKK